MAAVPLPVPLNTSVVFDGMSSDLAQIFYQRYAAGVTVEPLTMADADIPARIRNRLIAAGSTNFSALPGTLQRALVWDSGFAFDAEKRFVQIWTLGGRSMADIAVTPPEYNRSGCTLTVCLQPDLTRSASNRLCTAEMMLSVVKCLVAKVSNPNKHSAMWALGGDPARTPELNVLEHTWTEADSGVLNTVFAIHTESSLYPYSRVCPLSGYGAFVIPCAPHLTTDTTSLAGNAEPQLSTWVDTWLSAFPMTSASKPAVASSSPAAPAPAAPAPSPSGLSAGVIAGIIAAAVVVLVGVIVLCVRRRRSSDEHATTVKCVVTSDGFIDSRALLTPGTTAMRASTPSRSGVQCTATTSSDRTTLASRQDDDLETTGSHSAVLAALTCDPNLTHARLVFEKLAFEKLLARGAFGEVWLCRYDQKQQVAVKRLLQRTTQSTSDAIQAFANEIQLTASLQHANIVTFVGVAWTSAANLAMAIEYLRRGDLQHFVTTHRVHLGAWTSDKQRVALGVARALAYLHSHAPPVIHRDVKAKNVLLTDDLDAKLSDFGVSRDVERDAMTAGVGTPFWTAPEILDGSAYSERSDIYSFGVLLSELDTCALPYADTRGPAGEKLKLFQILSGVMSDDLRPQFTSACPPCVCAIAQSCLQHDPAMRPTAAELVQMLLQCEQS